MTGEVGGGEKPKDSRGESSLQERPVLCVLHFRFFTTVLCSAAFRGDTWEGVAVGGFAPRETFSFTVLDVGSWASGPLGKARAWLYFALRNGYTRNILIILSLSWRLPSCIVLEQGQREGHRPSLQLEGKSGGKWNSEGLEAKDREGHGPCTRPAGERGRGGG